MRGGAMKTAEERGARAYRISEQVEAGLSGVALQLRIEQALAASFDAGRLAGLEEADLLIIQEMNYLVERLLTSEFPKEEASLTVIRLRSKIAELAAQQPLKDTSGASEPTAGEAPRSGRRQPTP